MPQLDVVYDLDFSFNMDSSGMSWTLDIEIVSAILVEYDISWIWTSSIGKFISSSFCAYV
jgi:hypothetical protein